MTELSAVSKAYETDRALLLKKLAAFVARHEATSPTNRAQHTARKAFDPLADRLGKLIMQVNELYKLCARAGQLVDQKPVSKRLRQLDEERQAAVKQLEQAVYFHRQIVWLQDRFPRAEFEDVPGLCKAVTRKELEKADWSLTPGRYVGVSPSEVEEESDFDAALRDIHAELAGLNAEAAGLAARIQETLGAMSERSDIE
jgi:type I restriction enzyme M protein